VCSEDFFNLLAFNSNNMNDFGSIICLWDQCIRVKGRIS